jgi:hypothetical protein
VSDEVRRNEDALPIIHTVVPRPVCLAFGADEQYSRAHHLAPLSVGPRFTRFPLLLETRVVPAGNPGSGTSPTRPVTTANRPIAACYVVGRQGCSTGNNQSPGAICLWGFGK